MQKNLNIRYSRHLIIPEVGTDGQEKLLNAKVLIIGAGGLGSPASLYLAAAGVGTIGLVDNDIVNLSNLQRQILYSESDVGKNKINIAVRKLKELNPEIKIIPHEFKLTNKNALDIIKDYDVIVDGTDNFAARYLINDACVLLNKPNIYGSILRFQGQASVFYKDKGPCYRCLYPSPPDKGSVPSCDEAGVVGVLPGIIGSIQAAEAIKLIIGKGEPLIGRLLLLDGLQMRFREMRFDRNPDCPVCGDQPAITQLIDYEEFCNTSNRNMSNNDLEISVEELKKKIDYNEDIILLDVREPFEKEISDIGGIIIPLNSLPQRYDELDKNKEVIIYCRTGHRSMYAVSFLREQAGFKNVKNLKGGIYAWSDKIDPEIKKY